MLRPRQRNKHAHPLAGAAIEKPARRSVINPHEVQASLAHQCKIDIDLLSFSQIISVRVRLEWSVSDAFNKKFSVAFEKEFRDRANSRVCLRCHVERSRDISQWFLGFRVRDSSTSPGMTKEKCLRPQMPRRSEPLPTARPALRVLPR